METYGQLKIRIHIAYAQDQHGRVVGSWRTIYSKWTDRENVEQLLETFVAANPDLQHSRSQLHATFETRESIMM